MQIFNQVKNKRLIAAAVIEKNGKVFIAQRSDKDLYGKWEFPGGKVEKGESLEECLARELFEELSINVEVGKYLCKSVFIYKETEFEMNVFKVSSFSGEIILNEHSAFAWVNPEDLNKYSFPAPDLPIVKLLQEK